MVQLDKARQAMIQSVMQTIHPYTQLPGTDLTPFRICMGTVDIGSTLDETASFALLDAYITAGGNFIDTAKVYSDWLPNEGSTSEKAIGRWMQARRNRSDIILATKGAHPELDSMHIARMSPAEIQFDVEASLCHLQTDVIDLYWLHRDDTARPVEEIIDSLNTHVRAGKLRYLGCSNWHAERIQAANDYAARSGQQGFTADQPLWNLAQIDTSAITDQTMVVMDEALYAFHLESELPVVPYTSQANGLFNKMASGRYTSLGKMQQKMYAGPANQARFERLIALSDQTGLTVTQIVLGYLLSQPFTTIPIIGSHTHEQLQDSLTAAEILLDQAEIEFLLYGQ
jgi:aryl-alcohol dehydrogenase-like predicted oxidoreductase